MSITHTDEAAVLAGSECPGLRSPSDKIRIYEDVILELRGHLHNVYAAVGGLGALPLSESARSILGLSVAPLQRRRRTATAASGTPAPLVPNTAAATDKSRAASQPAAPPPAHCRPTLARDATHLQPASAGYCEPAPQALAPHNAPKAAAGTGRESLCRLAGSALAREELANTSYGQLSALVGALRQQVAELEQTAREQQLSLSEQQTDIEDLETALHERKSLVRTLRSQLKENELRRFAAASDSAGLRRTASIMIEPGVLLPELSTLAEWHPVSGTDANGMALKYPPRPLLPAEAASRMSRIQSVDSLESLPEGRSAGTSIDDARRPSGYVNGWPIYESDATRRGLTADAVFIASSAVAATTSTAATAAGPFLALDSYPQSSPQSVPARLLYKESDGSTLNMATAREGAAGSINSTRTPRLLRSMVVKGPRRLYSKLSNQLKRA
ncbi:hypothetical protein LPJ61_004261 [Coemansia biformis]|uniref:Uncharacterized protein n=1 Tax=Coemansia biformis TaxID=1286918 RepID=A0A9W7YB65_9FUNG|nr:hypothetical protein LPJ61_004261 [Coemansia biformis]